MNNELRSTKIERLFKTNPISEKPKMSLTHYMTKNYANKSPLRTMQKQTQTKPISNVPLKKLGISRTDYIYTIDETKKSV